MEVPAGMVMEQSSCGLRLEAGQREKEGRKEGARVNERENRVEGTRIREIFSPSLLTFNGAANST